MNIKCSVCDFHVNNKNFDVVNKKSALNVWLAYAFQKGEEGARNFCGIRNLPNQPEFKHYNNTLLQVTKEICNESMRRAVEECVAEIGSRYITAMFDGSWQRRGYDS